MSKVGEPNWPYFSTVYHIYVRSFKDSNQDGVGDLEGTIQKLDYLKDILGINAIWLSPIYPTPHNDFGYDIADYTNIDPLFGGLEKFDEFVRIANLKGIKVIMDFVPNHTSSLHPWFLASRASRNDPKSDWYIWANPNKDNLPPNNWQSVFGGSGWEFDQTRGQYYFHSFDKNQPDLNWRNPEVVEEMLNVLRFWLNRGIDGFRVDVPYHMYKDISLRDEPLNPNFLADKHAPYEMFSHIYTAWLPEYLEMLKQFVSVLKQYKNTFMVAETWTTLPELIKIYEAVGWKWFQPFNFSLITLAWEVPIIKTYIDEYDRVLGDMYIPCYVLGNHDVSRVVSRIGINQARIAAVLQLTLRGLPFIYYGDEIGMSNTPIPPEKVKDTFEKNSPGLNLGRDPQRTPMQWEEGKYAGFSDKEPWLPVNDDYINANVSKELGDNKSFLTLYRKLISLKQHVPAIKEGKYTPLVSPAENVFAYLREKEKNRVLVLLNFSSEDKKISLKYKLAEILLTASGSGKEGEKIDLSDFLLQRDEGLVFKV